MAITNFGSGIWLYKRRTRLAILKLTVPATIMRSAWRGVARKAPAPKRSMSKRDAPVAIISMAQQARPKVMGHMLDSRAQLMACSSDVVMTLSSNRPSSQPMTEPPDLTSRHADYSGERDRLRLGSPHGNRERWWRLGGGLVVRPHT